ncbi:hypothetical protein V8E53_003702 [Lactarius tabidus]
MTSSTRPYRYRRHDSFKRASLRRYHSPILLPTHRWVEGWTNINTDPTTSKRASSWEHKSHTIKAESLRGRADVTLGKNGFQFFHHPAKHTSFANDEEIEREYYSESI